MNENDATEYAYKKGYADGVKDVLGEIERNIFKIKTEYGELHCIPNCIPHGFIAELKQKYTEEKP